MNLYIIAVLTLLSVVIIIKNFMSFGKNNNSVTLNVRKQQMSLRDNPLKKKIENEIEKKAKVSSKFKIDTLCRQAGYNYTYGEYIMLCVIFSILCPIAVMCITPNVPLALIVAFVGFKLPKTLLKSKRTKRKEALDKQIGSFLDVMTERYKQNPNINSNIVESLESFANQYPIIDELENVARLINYSGYSPGMALDELARNTGNKYVRQFRDSYKISQTLPSDSAKETILSQAKKLYDMDYDLKMELKEKIAGPVKNAYFIMACVPVVMVYQSFVTPGYVDFMLHDPIGKGAVTGIAAAMLLMNWFVQAKINAPLEQED